VNIIKTILCVVLVTLVVAGGCVACAVGAVKHSYDDCEKAFNNWVESPVGTPQPAILTEDWCFKHLTGQDQ
jgi:hypothetical protein